MQQQQPLFAAFLEEHEIAMVGGAGQVTTYVVGEESHSNPGDGTNTTPLVDQHHFTTMVVGEEEHVPPFIGA
ncbi:hypothetical protein [Chromobacterium sp. IIBBL 290-4]|uniref:hypothetical protein n=1 Tax=Chromobacterium sp. IIBBL 290-4 TaxID=2953890 RepID=UPI0020B644A2|nr:hypothetical protein [Chromobacterium sp. IIBBL 290-4]UTH75794.1 hypothetical protein NKT35_06750 [Chromobacterium sp. IIBBL 290-4]